MLREWEEHSLINERARKALSYAEAREEVNLVIEYCLDTGGKRTRPIILLLSNGVAGGDIEEALDAAVAVEFVHNASLLHDDILDRGLYRRGQDTPYQKFGYKPALLSGDLLIMLALDLMVTSYGGRYVGHLTDVIKEITNGEILDVTSDEDSPLDEYEECIERKTAALFGTAAKIGGALAGSPFVDELETFAWKSGKAYQIVDDVLEFLSVEREKTALESSITLPQIYMRDRGLDEGEATEEAVEVVKELIDEATSELVVFEETSEKGRLKDLTRYMTLGTLERSGCTVGGRSIEELVA